MSDLRKLLHEGDEFERSLLDAAIDPDEERAREERTLAALGLGGPAGPGPGDGGATGGGAAVAKWLAFAAAGGAIVAGGIAFRPKTEAPIAPPTFAPAMQEAPVAVASAPPTLETTPLASESVPVPSAPPVVVNRPLPSASAPPQKPTTSTLAEEIRALDRARSALRAGDKERAKLELDRYDREFPFGSLGPEAKALRARADKK